MASKLKRRIPVIVSMRGSAAGVGATSWVGSTVPVGPEWLIPVATYNLGTTTPGGTLSLTGLYTANGGTPYFTFVSGQNISGTSVTMTVDSADGDITAPTTPTTYTVTVDLSSTSLEEQDWQNRIANAVWYHNFEHENEVKAFTVHSGRNDANGAGTTAVGYAPDVLYDSTDGIAGGGCLIMRCIAADVAYARDPLNPYSRGKWLRPLSPLAITNGAGWTRTDPGASGITTQPWNPWSNQYQSRDFRAGWYAHSSYHAAAQAANWTMEGSESTGYYIQFRVKIPMHRFVPTRVIPANGSTYGGSDPLAGQTQTFWTNTSATVGKQPAGKLMWMSTILTDGANAGSTPSHELVWSGGPKITNPPDNVSNASTGHFVLYTTQAGITIFNTRTTAGNSGAVVYEFPADEWATFLCYVKPGTTNAVLSLTGGNTETRVWVASNGSYIELDRHAALSLVFGAGDGTSPNGWSAFEPTNYQNGPDGWANSPTQYRNPTSNSSGFALSAGLAVTQTYDYKFTQIIFSRQTIPAPQDGV
jgi:hypothetical protein